MRHNKITQLWMVLCSIGCCLSTCFATSQFVWSCHADKTSQHWICSKTNKTLIANTDYSQTASLNEPDVSQLQLPDIAKRLQWISEPTTTNLCQGYYKKDPIPYDALPQSSDPESLINILADHSLVSTKDTSTLWGNVVITQPDKLASANRAYLYRDPNTNKPSKIKLEGNVHLREPNVSVIASNGTLYLPNKSWELHNILYQQSLETQEELPQKEQHVYGVSAWGRAKSIKNEQPNILDLYHASYTTCPPTSHTWSLSGSHIHLDKNTGRGSITNTVLSVKNVPVLYWPYFSFPIDDERHTGFLPPTFSHSSLRGDEITFPFYWNMAPNYDLTVSPHFMSERGTQLNTDFRYLNQRGSGNISFSILPNDSRFETFKDEEPGEFPTPTPAEAKQIQDLQDASNTRTALSVKADQSLTNHIYTALDYNRVSDDYYLSDLNNNLYTQTETQLLQQGLVSYQDDTMSLMGKLQNYQTLHPVDQAPVFNQYSRLPQLKFFSELPKKPYGLTFALNSEYDYFDIAKNPGQSALQPKGSRFNFQPSVSLPLARQGIYLVPRVQLVLTAYQLTDEGVNGSGAQNQKAPSRTLPIFDVRAGMKLLRDSSLFGRQYTQTLEPQLYYLYVPYENQNDLPIFDSYDTTQPLAFTYDQIFRYNRFTSIDRIGDANQLGVSLTSRLLTRQSGEERFRVSVGEILYFKNRQALLCSDNPANAGLYPSCESPDSEIANLNQQRVSPIAGILLYRLNNAWSVVGGTAWNQSSRRIENQTINFGYHGKHNHIFNLGYTFARDGDVLAGEPADSNKNNLQQSNISFAWPLTNRWSLLGQWGYNWSHDHMQNYVYGLEYESCCWGVRFVGTRTFTELTNDFKNQFDNAFYVQFTLKGLSRLGFSDPGGALTSNISGYEDNFGRYK